MLEFNPYILVTVAIAIIGVTIYAIQDIRKNMPKTDEKFVINRIDGELLDADSILRDAAGEKQVVPINLKVGSFRNYKKYSKEETMVYNSATPLTKIRIFLRTHLNNKYNLLNEQEYAVLLIIGFVIGGALGWWAMENIWSIIIVAIIGLITPEVYLNFQVGQYKEEINKQAVALIQLVIQAMRTGLSIGEAFERASVQLQGPIEKEVEILSEYFRSGFAFQDAAKLAKDETASSFLKKIYQVIIMSLETNISPENLIERLTIIRKNLINEFYLKQSMRAEAGGGTLAKNILIVIVPGLLFIVLKNSPDMLRPLIETPMGWGLSAGGIGMYVAGIVISNNVMKKLDV